MTPEQFCTRRSFSDCQDAKCASGRWVFTCGWDYLNGRCRIVGETWNDPEVIEALGIPIL